MNLAINREYNYKDWKFLELDTNIRSIHLVKSVKALMFFILVLRLLFNLRISLRLSFYYRVFFSILKELAGIAILFLLILIGFSIIISLFVGQNFYEMTSLFNTFLVAFKFILYNGEANYFYNCSNGQNLIFIFIVFLIGTAIIPLSFSSYKFVFYQEFKNYKKLKSQITFKSSGDYIDFFESFLYKNFFFVISKFIKLRRINKNIFKKIDKKFDSDKFNFQNGKKLFGFFFKVINFI